MGTTDISHLNNCMMSGCCRYALKEDTKVSYVGHLAGATAGLLLGVLVLCNLRRLDWETKLW